ncbi:MAG: G1 family glutamic endopeptidase [Candidatus Dormibacteria bacterium]
MTACGAAAASSGALSALAKGTVAQTPAHLRPPSLSTPSATTGPPGAESAESKVNPAQLVKDGNRVKAAVPPDSGSVFNTGAAGGAYTALSPTRLLDTRTSHQTPLGPDGAVSLKVTGGNVPDSATAVAINVTVTDTSAASYLTVYPTGEVTPLLSNLNWPAGDTVPNLVIVPVGSGGEVTFYNDAGTVDVVVDLEGYFAPETAGSTAGSYVPLAPTRITDTRTGSGYPNSGPPLGAQGSLNVQVTGEGGIPPTGVAAALLNVTVTDTSSPSFLTIYPRGGTQPLASNLNWGPGATIPNRVVVPVGPTGQITVFNDAGSVDVIIDVSGYFTDGTTNPAGASLFSAISPVRVLDTRNTGQTMVAGQSLPLQLSGVHGIATDASAVITNTTVTDTSLPGYLTIYPEGKSKNLTSDLNWYAGDTVPNLTVATLGPTGAIAMYNDQGTVDVVVDAFGYFVPESPQPLAVVTTSLPAGTQGSTYSADLSAYGGTPPYSWSILSGSLQTGLTLSGAGTISGTPTVAGSYLVTFQVHDSGSPTTQTATSAALTLTVDFATVGTVKFSNWSGYTIESGPYTAVSGDFTVPNVYESATTTDASEWVGIDGQNNSDLIQAGVSEEYDPSTPGTVSLGAWWEILPAAETLITDCSVNPCVDPAYPGDTVAVTIQQLSGSTWEIEVQDLTEGWTFSTDETYSGPADSCEWIVEAPEVGGTTSTLADYTPDVTFSNLELAGAQDTLTYDYMVQDGVQVSTPSLEIDANGFSVAYGPNAPAPP